MRLLNTLTHSLTHSNNDFHRTVTQYKSDIDEGRGSVKEFMHFVSIQSTLYILIAQIDWFSVIRCYSTRKPS